MIFLQLCYQTSVKISDNPRPPLNIIFSVPKTFWQIKRAPFTNFLCDTKSFRHLFCDTPSMAYWKFRDRPMVNTRKFQTLRTFQRQKKFRSKTVKPRYEKNFRYRKLSEHQCVLLRSFGFLSDKKFFGSFVIPPSIFNSSFRVFRTLELFIFWRCFSVFRGIFLNIGTQNSECKRPWVTHQLFEYHKLLQVLYWFRLLRRTFWWTSGVMALSLNHVSDQGSNNFQGLCFVQYFWSQLTSQYVLRSSTSPLCEILFPCLRFSFDKIRHLLLDLLTRRFTFSKEAYYCSDFSFFFERCQNSHQTDPNLSHNYPKINLKFLISPLYILEFFEIIWPSGYDR